MDITNSKSNYCLYYCLIKNYGNKSAPSSVPKDEIFFLINRVLTMADFFNQQCAQNTSLTNPQYERKRSVNIWNIKEADQIKFDYMKKTMKWFTFIDCYDYIIFLPPQFDYITKEHIYALNKDTSKSFIIKKKLRGVLDIEWKVEKPNDSEDTQKKKD